MKARSSHSTRQAVVISDKAAGSLRPGEAAKDLPAGPEPARFLPGTAVSCTPVIMKKVRVGPVAAKGAKRSAL